MDGESEVREMQRVVQGLRSETRVFVASLRDVSQLPALAAAGLHTFTFAPAIAEGLLQNPLSIAAANDFERAAANSLVQLGSS